MLQLKKKSIKDSINRVKSLQRYFSESAYEIGKELCYIKENCKHGEFEDIIKENFSFTPRYARTFMKIHNNYTSEECSDLPVYKLMEKLDEKDEEEDEIDYTYSHPEPQKTPLNEFSREVDDFKAKDIKDIKDTRPIDLFYKLKNFLDKVEAIKSSINFLNHYIAAIDDYGDMKDKIEDLLKANNKKLNEIGRLK